MFLKKLWCLILFLIVSFLCRGAIGADAGFGKDLVRYLGIEATASEQDVAKLMELKQRAEAPGLTQDERKKAYFEMFQQSAKMQQSNPPEPVLNTMVQYAMSWYCPGDSAPLPSYKAEPGKVAGLVKHGNGPIPMVLIPDVGIDASIFQTFQQRNERDYTMYAITLPGFGGTPALPPFEHRDYAALRLWKNAEAAVLNLMSKENLTKVVLVGHQGGAYLALRIALDHPDRVRAVISLNGLLYAPMSASKTLTKEDRLKMVKAFFPIELFPRPGHDCLVKAWDMFPSMLSNDAARAHKIAELAAASDAHVVWDHYAELFATDLTDEIPNLKVPLLAVAAVADPAQAQKTLSVTQWQGVQSPMVKAQTIDNSGPFIMQDNPQALDRAIHDFIK